MKTIKQFRLDAFLSFPPGAEAFELEPLNVLIGPNGSGKSNLIEAVELLHATPTGFAAAIRDGGGAEEWLWKGGDRQHRTATIDVVLHAGTPTHRPIRYRLEFTTVGQRVEVLAEAIEQTEAQPGEYDVYFYYRFQSGAPAINVRDPSGKEGPVRRHLQRETLVPDESVLAQRQDPDLYPELTFAARRCGSGGNQ